MAIIRGAQRAAPAPRAEPAADTPAQIAAATPCFFPIIDMRSLSCLGAEALPRRVLRLGRVPAGAFLPPRERRMSLANLLAALRHTAQWPENWRLAIDLPPRLLRRADTVARILDGAAQAGLSTPRLQIEIAEPLLEPGDTDLLLALAALRDAGVSITLDHFGAGDIGLGLLRRLPLSTVKLDRVLVRDLPQAQENAALVRAIAATAMSLHLVLAAGGISRDSQRLWLAGLGCTEGQGPLFPALLPATAAARAQPETRRPGAIALSMPY